MRKIGLYVIASILLLSMGIGCMGSAEDEKSDQDGMGKLVLPLVAKAESGIQYKLRDAVFDVVRNPYYWPCDMYGNCGGLIMNSSTGTKAVMVSGVGGTIETIVGSAGKGGTTQETPAPIVIDSEDDPDAVSMEVELEEGYYNITLRDGWRIEKVVDGKAQTVEATALNGTSQWINITRHRTSLVAFEFGIGERSIWFDGKLHVNVNVYEDPDTYYGPWATEPPSSPAACRAMVNEYSPDYAGEQTNCLCKQCTWNFGQCMVDAKCDSILKCALDNECTDYSCMINSCSDLTNPYSNSVDYAYWVINCASQYCSTPTDGGEPGTPEVDAGVLPPFPIK
jgi:hypothetical protein